MAKSPKRKSVKRKPCSAGKRRSRVTNRCYSPKTIRKSTTRKSSGKRSKKKKSVKRKSASKKKKSVKKSKRKSASKKKKNSKRKMSGRPRKRLSAANDEDKKMRKKILKKHAKQELDYEKALKFIGRTSWRNKVGNKRQVGGSEGDQFQHFLDLLKKNKLKEAKRYAISEAEAEGKSTSPYKYAKKIGLIK